MNLNTFTFIVPKPKKNVKKYTIILTIIIAGSLLGMVTVSQVYSSVNYSVILKPETIEINKKHVEVRAWNIYPELNSLHIGFSNLTDIEFELEVSKDKEILSTNIYRTNDPSQISIINNTAFTEGGLYDLKITILSSHETGKIKPGEFVFNTKTSVIQEKTFYIIPDSSLHESDFTISTGTFNFWDPIQSTTTITSDKIIFSETNRDPDESLPVQSMEAPISKQDWQKLIGSIDFDEFNSLPDQVGCPGCADNTVIWIEISNSTTTKKISFEPQDIIPEINELRTTLDEIIKK